MDNNHKNCKCCEIVGRALNGQYKGCASIGNELAALASQAMRNRLLELTKEIENKFTAGEISEDDVMELVNILSDSYSIASAMVPGLAVSLGAEISPRNMMLLVTDYLLLSQGITPPVKVRNNSGHLN